MIAVLIKLSQHEGVQWMLALLMLDFDDPSPAKLPISGPCAGYKLGGNFRLSLSAKHLRLTFEVSSSHHALWQSQRSD